MLKIPGLVIAAAMLAACGKPPAHADHLDEALRIAAGHIILDTHIDVPYRLNKKREDISRRTEDGNFDYPRAREGGLDTVFMSIYVPASYETSGRATAFADQLIDLVESVAADAQRFDGFVAANRIDPESEQATAFSESYVEDHPLPFASLDDVLDHIDHVVAIAGVDHVGLGSDFDGVGDSLPIGLKDVSDYPNLIAGLLRRGYSESDIDKIVSGNLLRVWTEIESRAATLSRAGSPAGAGTFRSGH